jgi:hypothetical protein
LKTANTRRPPLTKAQHHTVDGVEFNPDTLKNLTIERLPQLLKPGNVSRANHLHREPLLPQRVTSDKPCKDDSITPVQTLQEVKVSFFGHLLLIGIVKGRYLPPLRLGSCQAIVPDVEAQMKRPLEEAAELFRENEACAGADREKANLYRGLSLLAEGLQRLEKGVAEVGSEMEGGPAHFYQQGAASTTTGDPNR